jgi:hypothetical protein
VTINAGLLSSKNGSYLTPPSIIGRVHRFLKEKAEDEHRHAGVEWDGKVPPFGDPFTNGASLVGAKYTCDLSKGQDGNTVDWGTFVRPHGERAFAYENPEYGDAIAAAMATTHRFGRELESCEIVALLPNRPDTRWCQRHVHASADAWIDVAGRLTFWLPIEIAALRQWHPGASDDHLPDPWRLLEPGWAVGPEVGHNGKPCAAPFPSLIGYWGPSVRLFAKHFGKLGTLSVARDRVVIPPMPSDGVLAGCPPEVAAWVRAASQRVAGVYPRVGVRE